MSAVVVDGVVVPTAVFSASVGVGGAGRARSGHLDRAVGATGALLVGRERVARVGCHIDRG